MLKLARYVTNQEFYMTIFRPFFSVIVPTYERAQQLSACLRALSGQTYPHDCFEVIVVNDGGTTLPKRVIEGFVKVFKVKLVTQTHSGPAAARNYGVKHATGDFLAFTDDDCAPAPNWLQALAGRFAALPDCAVGGRTINGVPDNPYSTVSQLLVDYLYAHCNSDPERATFFTSNNLALPAKAFHAIGGFDAVWKRAAGEDRELCDRWLANGHQMIYAPEAVVEHLHSLTWRTFARQHFNYGRGAFYFHKTCAGRRQIPVKVERISFYMRTLRYPFSRARPAKAVIFASLMMGAQAANAAGYFWERRSHRKQIAPCRPR
ncbi:MAG: glycosyltransferase [Candidatus Binatia bacterium]